MAAIAVILISASGNQRRLPLIIGVTVLMFFLADAFSGFASMEKLLTPSTLSTRLPLWMAAWSMFLDAPWLGQGPGAFSILYPQYLATLTLPDWVVMDPRHMPWAHNLYLELLAERGSIGCTTFLAAIALTFRPLLGRRVQRSRSAAAHARTTTLLCGALLLTGGLFEFSLLRLWFLVLIAVIAGFSLVLHNETE